MDNAFRVRGFERVHRLHGDAKQFRLFKRTALEAVLKRLSFEQLHHDKRRAFKFTNIVDGADVGVVQGGSRSRFALEAFEGLRIPGHVRR